LAIIGVTAPTLCRVKDVSVLSTPLTGSLKVTVTFVFKGTSSAPSPGDLSTICGFIVSSELVPQPQDDANPIINVIIIADVFFMYFSIRSICISLSRDSRDYLPAGDNIIYKLLNEYDLLIVLFFVESIAI
jgi:hypothetical protein